MVRRLSPPPPPQRPGGMPGRPGQAPPLIPRNPMIPTGNRVAENAMPAENRPQPNLSAGTYKTEAFTYITTVGPEQVLYTGDQDWAKVTLTLQTAGPVAASTRQTITPVLSGKAPLLQTGVPFTLTVAKGNRIYIAATNVNRVSVVVEPFAWEAQKLGALLNLGRGT
jgi:hypothetical protein